VTDTGNEREYMTPAEVGEQRTDPTSSPDARGIRRYARAEVEEPIRRDPR